MNSMKSDKKKYTLLYTQHHSDLWQRVLQYQLQYQLDTSKYKYMAMKETIVNIYISQNFISHIFRGNLQRSQVSMGPL